MQVAAPRAITISSCENIFACGFMRQLEARSVRSLSDRADPGTNPARPQLAGVRVARAHRVQSGRRAATVWRLNADRASPLAPSRYGKGDQSQRCDPSARA